MTPKQQTNWQLYKSHEDLINPHMASWVEEDNSLMKRLNDEKQKISLRVIFEKICLHDESELNYVNVEGNLRRIFLTGSSDIVFAESFFSNEVIKKFKKFGRLEIEPLGKFLFSDTNITKHETYVATFINGDQNFQGRKCIYDYAGSKFSVIEVFLFND
ncbi:MAG: chorismate lyase [Gammaproteobacteria bacterium]|uniref:Chorismate lyase n=1 Tax=SAR86 cluster bacterium TaxID=2030880 RepID=A0A520MUH8_9GAMM|nr:MAG: chorismate lyase [SAR86 cluster bacterium]|tara:strand:+ start:369 stop:845 length:477 start_codon:yes stop_codon:yes gene_type:complete